MSLTERTNVCSSRPSIDLMRTPLEPRLSLPSISFDLILVLTSYSYVFFEVTLFLFLLTIISGLGPPQVP